MLQPRSQTFEPRKFLKTRIMKTAIQRQTVLCGASALMGVLTVSLGLVLAHAEPTQTKSAQKRLTGAELYAINCNRCHAERYPPEFTASQWKTIMLEMRVRANLPARQSQAILKYLQEDAGGN
jgi:mono/diheme cytochrome c family protein